MCALKFMGLILFLAVLKTHAGVIKTTESSLEAKPDLEKALKDETENFLNNMFKAQMEFYGKMKNSLKPDTKRFKDMGTLIKTLELAKEEHDLEKKNEIYWNVFKKSVKSPVLVNNQAETDLNDEEFAKILSDNNFKEVLTSIMADVAVYFWKMAKASGKVLETSMDDYIANMQKTRTIF